MRVRVIVALVFRRIVDAHKILFHQQAHRTAAVFKPDPVGIIQLVDHRFGHLQHDPVAGEIRGELVVLCGLYGVYQRLPGEVGALLQSAFSPELRHFRFAQPVSQRIAPDPDFHIMSVL